MIMEEKEELDYLTKKGIILFLTFLIVTFWLHEISERDFGWLIQIPLLFIFIKWMTNKIDLPFLRNIKSLIYWPAVVILTVAALFLNLGPKHRSGFIKSFRSFSQPYQVN